MKKSILILSCLLLGVGSLTPAFSEVIAKNIQKQSENIHFENSYKVGTILDIPTHKITEKGKSYDTKAIVYYPSGKAYIEESVVLNEFGIYVIEYRAVKDDGEILSEKFEFETYSDLYSINGNISAKYGVDESSYQTGIEGLALELTRESTFKYNEIINLNSLGSSPFVDLFVLPSKGAGSRDLIRLVFKLEDIHNPDNYLLIRAQSAESDGGGDPWWANVTYIEAGASNQNPAGVEWGPPMQIHTGGKFGHPTPFSMYGYRNFTNSVGQESLSLRLDLEEKRLYGTYEFGENYIVDFDDKRFFNEPWSGFSTNEIYLSIWGENFINDTCPLMVTRIGKSDLSQEYLRDRMGPEITLDTKGYTLNDLPNGIVGRKYPIFSAFIRDDCSNSLDYSTKVFYNYASSTRYELPIVDGHFTPTLPGKYTIEYYSKDYYRNETKLIYEIEAVESSEIFNVEVDKSVVKEGLVGVPYEIINPLYKGNIGSVKITKKVSFNNKNVEIVDNSFVPLEKGKYTVTYSVEDICETKTASYEIDVKENKNPVFIDQGFVPKYIIEGNTYEFFPSVAKDFMTGEIIQSKILIKDKNHNFDEYKSPLVLEGENGQVSIKHIAETSKGKTEQTFVVPVIDCGEASNLKIENYIHSSDAIKKVNSNGVSLSISSVSDKAFEFINVLNNKTFSLNFSINAESEEFTLCLKDSVNSDKFINLKFERDVQNNSQYTLLINDNKTILKADTKIQNSLSIDFVKGILNLNSSSTSFKPIDFSKTGIYFSGILQGNHKDFTLTLENINGQKLTKGAPSATPTMVFENEYRTKGDVNSTLKVIKPMTFDVLNPYVTTAISVTYRGTAINSADGRKMENITDLNNLTFTLSGYGDYSIIYNLNNGHGGTNRRIFVIKSVDNVKPTITLGGENDAYGKVFVPYAFYKATAEDNYSSTVQIYYYVQSPNGSINNIYEMMIDEHDYSFTIVPNKVGIWKIIYLAVDESGNFASVETSFEVEE